MNSTHCSLPCSLRPCGPEPIPAPRVLHRVQCLCGSAWLEVASVRRKPYFSSRSGATNHSTIRLHVCPSFSQNRPRWLMFRTWRGAEFQQTTQRRQLHIAHIALSPHLRQEYISPFNQSASRFTAMIPFFRLILVVGLAAGVCRGSSATPVGCVDLRLAPSGGKTVGTPGGSAKCMVREWLTGLRQDRALACYRD